MSVFFTISDFGGIDPGRWSISDRALARIDKRQVRRAGRPSLLARSQRSPIQAGLVNRLTDSSEGIESPLPTLTLIEEVPDVSLILRFRDPAGEDHGPVSVNLFVSRTQRYKTICARNVLAGRMKAYGALSDPPDEREPEAAVPLGAAHLRRDADQAEGL